MTRFDTVLIANRGEIALRVIRAATATGLRTVAVYSDADRDAPHVRAADVAVRIGPAAATDSYLSIPALLDAAERSGADAIHPGYGFLSERSAFARAVVDSGRTFVGPSAEVMDAMGRKDRARVVAIEAGVPVVPAADSAVVTDLDEVARQVGFPLLAKAAAGGGGKGMRIVRTADEFPAAVAAARREALSAFGDDTMLFERYVERGRHIEVQILADTHGNVVHLFERDCSVQRRHQKVLEEAPSAVISAEVRDVVLASAVALARQVGYVNAGTVEFLVADEGAYFLEMNTRLQVEHPVTELVTGLDLVALQFAVAQGEVLPFAQSDIAVHGHAIEARVYAEDPFHGFLPQAGVATIVQWPSGVRVDAALASGQRVGTYYDPMLGKIIVHGPTREAARRSLVNALDQTAIVGLTTNAGFLRSLADSDAFAKAEIDTAWLDRFPDAVELSTPEAAWLLAAWALATHEEGDPRDPLGRADGWRLAGPAAGIPISLTVVGELPAGEASTRLLIVHPGAGVVIDGERSVSVQAAGFVDGRLRLEIEGELVGGHIAIDRHQVLVAYQGQTHVFDRPDPFGSGSRGVVSDGSVASPMPGTVLAVHVATGDEVAEGQTLGVMEAMKMELALKAPFAGVVGEVSTTAGAQVDLGAVLFVIEAPIRPTERGDASRDPVGRIADGGAE